MRWLDRVGHWALLALMVSCLTACGGGGGGGTATPSTPSALGGDMRLVAANIRDQDNSVVTEPEFVFTFDRFVATGVSAASVILTDSQGIVPVAVDVQFGLLRVKPLQGLKMRADHTLTIRTGLQSTDGATLKEDVVRRFRTVLFGGRSVIVYPSNQALTNYPGDYTFRIADVNADGRPDIVQIGGDAELTGSDNGFAVNVFLQGADQTFSRAQNLLIRETQSVSPNRMGDIAVVDLNHDGRPEVVVSIQRLRSGPSGLLVLSQDAQGRYAPGEFLATNFAYRLFVTDIDRDGKQDVFAVGQGLPSTEGPDSCGMVALMSTRSGPRLQSSMELPCERYEATLGSFDAAGSVHLVIVRRSFTVPAEALVPRIRVFRIDAQGRASLDSSVMNAMGAIGAGYLDCSEPSTIDVNGDRIDELLFNDCRPDMFTGVSVVYARSAAAPFAEWTRNSLGISRFMVADMDRDGLEDIVGFVQGGLAGSFVAGGFALQSGGLELTHLEPIRTFDARGSNAAIADMNGDGFPDIVMDGYGTGIQIMYQTRR